MSDKIPHEKGISIQGNCQHCAGCGKILGVFSISCTDSNLVKKDDIKFPFDYEDCPVCENLDKEEIYSASEIAKNTDIRTIQNALIQARSFKQT